MLALALAVGGHLMCGIGVVRLIAAAEPDSWTWGSPERGCMVLLWPAVLSLWIIWRACKLLGYIAGGRW